jgi:hypothetical protein
MHVYFQLHYAFPSLFLQALATESCKNAVAALTLLSARRLATTEGTLNGYQEFYQYLSTQFRCLENPQASVITMVAYVNKVTLLVIVTWGIPRQQRHHVVKPSVMTSPQPNGRQTCYPLQGH